VGSNFELIQKVSMDTSLIFKLLIYSDHGQLLCSWIIN
jgi:hypothetical protein